MPETMSIERRKLAASYGAEIVLTPGSEGMRGAVNRAEELAAETPGAVLVRQFANPANVDIHRRTTAEEIWNDTDGTVDIIVAGIGTGGTITGVGQVLKARKPEVHVVAVEPAESPLLSGGSPGPHKIQGIGANFIPGNYDKTIIDKVLDIKDADAFKASRQIALEEGILVGISAGANLAAAILLADELGEGKVVVTVLCDTGERYLSTALFEEE
jgi:cysteine synthase A